MKARPISSPAWSSTRPSGGTMQDETADGRDVLDCRVTGSQKGVTVLADRHVELVIPQAVLAKEMIAHEIRRPGFEDRFYRRMELKRISLVTQLVNRLIGHDGVE